MNLTEFKNSKEAQKPHYLLLGHPVEHSWSPLMHNTALEFYGMDAKYHAINLRGNELTDLATYLNRDELRGVNITIPYKQFIFDYLDEINGKAEEIGAVNTIVKEEFRLKGFNTDWMGFLKPLEKLHGQVENGRAIIFGTGGASRAIVAGLGEINIGECHLVSRNPEKVTSFDHFNKVEVISYHEWTSLSDEASLIVNATPLGMHPKTEKSPVREGEKQFLGNTICYDVVYNPIKTKFLKQAESVGAATIGGLEMLIQQGSKSFEYWTGRPFPIEAVREKLHEKLTD